MAVQMYEENWRRAVNKNTLDLFTFKIDGKRISVPKSVLIAQSEYFATKFSSDMKDSKAADMVVKEYSYNVINKLVHFLFAPQTAIESAEIALGLFKAADFFQIAHVKFAAGNYLIENGSQLTPEIVLNVFAEAELQNSKQIMKVALEYVLKNKIDVTQLADYDKLTPQQTKILVRAQNKALCDRDKSVYNGTDIRCVQPNCVRTNVRNTYCGNCGQRSFTVNGEAAVDLSSMFK